ncbi:hypothetical protein [Streptomyces olivaceoviridis]
MPTETDAYTAPRIASTDEHIGAVLVTEEGHACGTDLTTLAPDEGAAGERERIGRDVHDTLAQDSRRSS